MSDSSKPRRPSFREPAALEALGERHDPIEELHAAHESARVLVHRGRAASDPEVTRRLVALTDEVGLVTLTDLWGARPARSLPGALYRIYTLREWVRLDPVRAATQYANGVASAEVSHVVAGAEPPGPDEVVRVADEILRGVYTGDLAVALDRASAFCRVVVAGRVAESRGSNAVLAAARLRDMADDLTADANLWRQGRLD